MLVLFTVALQTMLTAPFVSTQSHLCSWAVDAGAQMLTTNELRPFSEQRK